MLNSDPAPHGQRFAFERAPLRVYWEVTRACSLACRHCRAEASPNPDRSQLSTAEGKALLERIAAFGEPLPHVVLTGGDPLERADLFELVAFARSLGLKVSVSPSATRKLTPDTVRAFAHAGVQAISLSIDGATAAGHDALRGAPGCFERTLIAARAASDATLPVQVNTLVSAETVDDLPRVYDLTVALGVARWSLFFLVSVGRGTVLESLCAHRAEDLLGWLAELPRDDLHPIVTTTEAPHFRRVVLGKRHLFVSGAGRAAYGIRDGNGILFVSHTGDISPSGFLPIAAGRVRTDDVVTVYRGSPLFVSLRQATGFHGRCGVCRFRAVCGGSRARAWAASGDPLGEDPLCPYQPGA